MTNFLTKLGADTKTPCGIFNLLSVIVISSSLVYGLYGSITQVGVAPLTPCEAAMTEIYAPQSLCYEHDLRN